MRWRPNTRPNCWQLWARKGKLVRNQMPRSASYACRSTTFIDTHHLQPKMKSSKSILLAVAFIALALLGGALYLQHVKDMQPCPLCVIQRYAFATIALICLLSASMPDSIRKASAAIGILAGIGGAATAGWHLWVIAHPSTSCGRDALEAPLNALPTATLLPSVFKVDAWALCSAAYEPILGLSLPQWSLLWFVVLIVILGKVLLQRSNRGDFE